jgi:hypothetical protein
LINGVYSLTSPEAEPAVGAIVKTVR